MSAVIVDDGTMDTVVEYDGMQIRYESSYRYAIQESLPPDITLCYNDDCRCWKTPEPNLEGYATVKCLLGCKDYKVLYKELPKITDAMWNRLQLEASDS